jgi:hypothetical protein
MRSTEEFWNRRNAESTDLENWLLSRQVLPQQQPTSAASSGNRTPSNSGAGRRNRRSRSEERPKNSHLHGNSGHVGNMSSHLNLAGKPATDLAGKNVHNNNIVTTRGIYAKVASSSEKEFRMSKMIVQGVQSEDSGNSSLNTSTTDSRKSRRNQKQMVK